MNKLSSDDTFIEPVAFVSCSEFFLDESPRIVDSRCVYENAAVSALHYFCFSVFCPSFRHFLFPLLSTLSFSLAWFLCSPFLLLQLDRFHLITTSAGKVHVRVGVITRHFAVHNLFPV